MNITIDSHLKHSPQLISHGTTSSAAVLLKLDFGASLDLHIEEQLHRICRCLRSFSFRHCILRHPYSELYHGVFWAYWHHCKASSLLRATAFLTAKMLLLLCLMLPERVCLWLAYHMWNRELGCQRDLELQFNCFTIKTVVKFSTNARTSAKQSCLDTVS